MVQVEETWTEVYARISATPSPLRVVVIPGNPGNVTVYELFIDEVFRLLHGHCSVIGMSHAGHGAPGRNGNRLYTVNDQIDHKVALLNGLVAGTWEELKESGNSQPNNFVLMGHSIGAFFALKAWKRTHKTQVNVIDAMLLMPTICELYKGYSWFNRIVTLPYIRNAFANFAHYQPSGLLKAVVSRVGNQGDKLSEMVSTKIDYHIVLNITAMGHEEGATIFEIDEEITDALNIAEGRAFFIYSPRDPYTPQSIIDDTVSKFPKASVTMSSPSIPHAFVISHTLEVAQLAITKLLENSHPELALPVASSSSPPA